MPRRLLRVLTLPRSDLLRDAVYRRLWTSILIGSFGGQVTMLALPLTAAVLLHATPIEMGRLTAMEVLPFALFALPCGVWLDRVRKLPVVVAGEWTIAAAVTSVPLALWAGWLQIGWLYAVAFVLGCVQTVAGSASQIVLTQVVPRERLVEAHAKNALANSGAEVAGPGLAGLLIKLLGPALALFANALLLAGSALILRGMRVREHLAARSGGRFVDELAAGLRFVFEHRLLVTLAFIVGTWQMCQNAAVVVQILVATRSLGLSGQAVGLCYVALGVGTVFASAIGNRLSRRIGPGPCLVLGVAACSSGWLLLALVPAGAWGVAAFATMLALFGLGAPLIFINFLALRQAVTPTPLLGRMTSTMRWLILLPASPGALLGGWLGQHFGLRSALVFSGSTSALLALAAWHHPVVRGIKALPRIEAGESSQPLAQPD